MDISCNKCTQKYHIPDDQLSSKRIYFNCEKCGYKIILDLRGENWLTYKGLDSPQLSSKDLLEGIYYSFNIKNIFVTFFILLSYLFFYTILTLIVTKNRGSLYAHPELTGVILFIITVIMLYVFDIHLYLISKNVFNTIKQSRNHQFSSISNEIFEDLKPIFIISAGIIIFFALIFFPVFLMSDNYALIYGGIFHSLNLVLVSLLIFIFLMKNILTSFIALRNRNFKDTFRAIFKFIAIENINLPLYLFFTCSITGFIFMILQGIIALGLFLIIMLLAPSLTGKAGFSMGNFFSSIFDGNFQKITGEGFRYFGSLTDGMGVVIISTIIIFIFILSYIINLNQTLSSVAVFIMEKNPGRTINKKIILLLLSIIFAIFLCFIAYSLF